MFPRRHSGQCNICSCCNVCSYGLGLWNSSNFLRLPNDDEPKNEIFSHLDSLVGILVSPFLLSSHYVFISLWKLLLTLILKCKLRNHRSNRLHPKLNPHRRLVMGRNQPGKMVHGRASHRNHRLQHRDPPSPRQKFLLLRSKAI